MIKIFLGLKSFDVTKAKFKSWTISIAKNYLIDKWRVNTLVLTSLNTPISNTTDNQYTWIDNYSSNTNNNQHPSFSVCSNNTFENNNSINYISTQLSPQDYSMLDMKYVHGYDYCEIGKEFNLTSNTVSNRVNYIKTKLKNSVLEEDYL